MPQTTIEIAATGDDGLVRRINSAVYPPNTSDQVFTNLTDDFCSRELNGGTFWVAVGLLRFDTSAIPDDATITAAELKLYVTSKGDADNRGVTAEWYSASNWPIDAADYTATAAATAHAGVDITSITLNSDLTMALLNPATNINKTGYTGLRLHVSGGQPAGVNYVVWSAFDHATNIAPRLVVTYDTADLEGTYFIDGLSTFEDGDVEADLYVDSVNDGEAHIILRDTGTNATQYLFGYGLESGAKKWMIWKKVSGVRTLLASATEALTTGQTYRIRANISDAQKRLYVNGVEKCSTTNNDVGDAGRVGVQFKQSGYHFGDIIVKSPETTVYGEEQSFTTMAAGGALVSVVWIDDD